MKAVVIHALGGPEQLTLAEMPDPAPGAGEVLIDVAYAGCNWADRARRPLRACISAMSTMPCRRGRQASTTCWMVSPPAG